MSKRAKNDVAAIVTFVAILLAVIFGAALIKAVATMAPEWIGHWLGV